MDEIEQSVIDKMDVGFVLTSLSDDFFEHVLIILHFDSATLLKNISVLQSINQSFLALLILSQKSTHSFSTRNLKSPSLKQRIASIPKSFTVLIPYCSFL